MRNPNRRPIVLEIFKSKPDILLKFLNVTNVNIVYNIYDTWEEIEKKWEDYPDLRFGQLLCNLRLIPSIDVENHIWNIEESDWLIENDYCKFEDIKFWGSLYDEHNHKRKEIKFILLKDLDLSHIKSIVKWFKNDNQEKQINSKYLEYFNKRIELNE